jgi:hypothetical protein
VHKDDKWNPITDLDENPKSLTDGELESLRRIWADQKNDLAERGLLGEFDKRLRREWSIETGIIENVYTLDRGVTRTLIEKGIDAALIPHGASDRDSTLMARIIQDHYDALDNMFDFVGGRRQLLTSYVKELHAALLRNQDTHTVVDQFGKAFEKQLEKGQYKLEPNSPTRSDGFVHEYAPPEHVASEMDQLLLVFIQAGWYPLIVKSDESTQYIEALEKGDHEDIRLLVATFVEAQRSAIIQATEGAYGLRPNRSADEAIVAARDRRSRQ